MTEKRFKHSEIIQDDGQTICYGIEDTQTRHIFNVIGEGIYDVSEKELIELLNELNDENEQLKYALNQRTEQCDKYYQENEYYKSIFLELVETALTDKNCRELYCKGILDIFDKANSLNQAREIIKEYLK